MTSNLLSSSALDEETARAHQQDRPTVITLQMEGTNERELEEGWKRDAVTLTEEDYIRKHYYDKAETSNSGIPMDMYLGLCTGRLLSMSLLLAITEVQLPKKWNGMQNADEWRFGRSSMFPCTRS